MKFMMFFSFLFLVSQVEAKNCSTRALSKFDQNAAAISEEKAADFFECLIDKGAPSAAVPHLIHMISKSKSGEFQEKTLSLVLDHLPRDYESYLFKKLSRARLNISPELRSDLHYYFALNSFDRKNYKKAYKYLVSQKRDLNFVKKADSKFLEAVLYTSTGQLSRAESLFRELAQGKFQSKKRQKIMNSSKLNVARLLMANNDLQGAVDYYREVSFRDSEWFDGLVEMTWAMLSQDDYEGAIGNAEFISRSTQESIYKPWVNLVQSIGLLKLCQFPQAKKTLDLYKTNYKNSIKEVQTSLSLSRPQNWYDYLTSLYEMPLNKSTFKKHPPLLFYTARNSRLINFQERINELVKEEKALKTLKRRLKKSSFAHKLVTRKLKSVSPHIDRLEKTTGASFKRILNSHLIDHKKLNKIAATLDFEIFSRSSKNITHRIAGEKFQDKLKETKSKEASWSYVGEFWTDEAGRFRSFLENNCAVKEMASK